MIRNPENRLDSMKYQLNGWCNFINKDCFVINATAKYASTPNSLPSNAGTFHASISLTIFDFSSHVAATHIHIATALSN